MEKSKEILIEEAIVGKEATDGILKNIETLETLLVESMPDVLEKYFVGLKMNFTGMNLEFSKILDKLRT